MLGFKRHKCIISRTLSWIKSDYIFQDQAVTAVNEIRSSAVDKIEKGFKEVQSAVEVLKKWMEEKLDSSFDKEYFLQLATLSSNICTLNASLGLVMAVGEGRDRNGIFWKP